MKPIVSLTDTNNKTDSRFSNSEKVIKRVAESGKMNKWDIMKKSGLRYPRVHEAVSVLEKNGYVEVVSEKTCKNRHPSKEYSLTFKGALSYLASTDLEHPRRVGKADEPKEDFKKQYIKDYQNYINRLNHLRNVIKTFGADLNIEIFRQIDWLIENYGLFIFDIILKSAKKQKINQPNFFTAERKQQELEKQHLTQWIETIRGSPSLQTMGTFRSDGKGNKVTGEINVLQNKESRLEQLKNFVDSLIENENKYWKNSFAYDFFEELAHMAKKKEGGNEPLARLAKELLEVRRKALVPMEKIVKKLEGE